MSETVECSLPQLEPLIRQLLTSSLATNEQPLICVKHKGQGALRIYVVAESRIVTLYRPDLLVVTGAPVVYTFFIDDIVGFTREDNSPVISINIQFHSGYHKLIFESRQIADKFVSVFQEALTRSKTKPDTANRLRQLAQLHKEGLISDSEFEQKRKDILGQM
jgi:hypothetical protein